MGKVRSNSKVRGRYHQSVTPYEENLDVVSYILGRTPVARKVASACEAFNSPTVGLGKYMSVIAQQYIGAGSGNSSCGIGAELSVSPLLSTLENLEAVPLVYGTPLKVDEEVLVMDEILVRSTPSGGKGGRSSSSGKSRHSPEESGNCSYSSQCRFAYGSEELHAFESKFEGQEGKSSPGTVSSTPGPRSHPVPLLLVAAASEHYGIATQPASPIKPEPDHNLINPTTFNDWSPLDDDIECFLSHASTDKPSSREEVDAHLSKIMTGSTRGRRLPVFVEIFPDDE